MPRAAAASLKPGGTGTKIALEYIVGGYMRYKVEDIAPAVDKVMAEQLAGLAVLLGTPNEAPGSATGSAKPKTKRKPAPKP